MEKLTEFLVTGERRINCAACESRIASALQRLPGVTRVKASAETQRVTTFIDASAATGSEQVRAGLEQLGYAVKGVMPESDYGIGSCP
jgi:copper chaperone CopZ